MGEYTLRQLADVTLIRLQGRIDHNKAKDFESELKPILDSCAAGQERRIPLDMSGVDFMTSAGLRVLMVAAKTCGKHKGEIVVAALQPTVLEIFKISRFDLILKIFPAVEAALDKMSPTAADLYRTA
jgi:anti-anti-sigma factor